MLITYHGHLFSIEIFSGLAPPYIISLEVVASQLNPTLSDLLQSTVTSRKTFLNPLAHDITPISFENHIVIGLFNKLALSADWICQPPFDLLSY